MIHYSVLIPHKNQPDLLRKCIASIPHRQDVQIIVVDDNSDCEVVDFNNFPGMDDPFVEIYYTKEGRGAGYARNFGLQYVKGKWLILLGADDYFNECIDNAMRLFEEDNSDVIFLKGTAVFLNGGSLSSRSDYYNSCVDTALNSNNFVPVLLCSCDTKKFFSIDFLRSHNIKFSECRWGNDVYFMGQVARYANRFKASYLPIYCTTESDSNLTKVISVESQVVRLKEECKNVRILRPRYSSEDSIYYWLFESWFKLYKLNKFQGLLYLPKALIAGRGKFLTIMLRSKFS